MAREIRAERALPITDNLTTVAHRMVLREILNGIKRVSPPNPQRFGEAHVDGIRVKIRNTIQNHALCLKEFGRTLSSRERGVIMGEVEAIINPLAERFDD